MAKISMKMVEEARAVVPSVCPVDAQQRLQEDPDAPLLEARDAGEISRLTKKPLIW